VQDYEEPVEQIKFSLACMSLESNSGSGEIEFSSKVERLHQHIPNHKAQSFSIQNYHPSGWKFFHRRRRTAFIDKLLHGHSFELSHWGQRDIVGVSFAKVRVIIPAKWDLRSSENEVEIMAELA
jgi:hypothetical protein